MLSALFLMINNNDDFLLLRRILFMLGITALLRPFIFCMTSLPDPSEYNPSRSYLFLLFLYLVNVLNTTSEEQKPEEITLAQVVNYTFTRLHNPQDIETSGDMLFSGHTRYLITAVCVQSWGEFSVGVRLDDSR